MVLKKLFGIMGVAGLELLKVDLVGLLVRTLLEYNLGDPLLVALNLLGLVLLMLMLVLLPRLD